jgi:hypothetical protein
MNKLLPLLLLAAVGYLALRPAAPPAPPAATPPAFVRSEAASDGAAQLAEAQQKHSHQVELEIAGVVAKVLPDDRQGLRHQRFIVRLANGQTLLVAHNIDEAPRVAGLQAGDQVRVHGEYIWNAKGGLLHWTHRDQRGRHPSGWIRHAGQTYQ